MYRQTSNSNKVKVFYRGITLKEYLRKSQVLITQDNKDETLLVDEFSNPLVKVDDFFFCKSKVPTGLKLESQDFSTKVSTTKSVDQDFLFPYLQKLKPMANLQIKNIFHPACSEQPVTVRGKKKAKTTQLPLLDLSKSKNMKLQNFNEEVIKKRGLTRQKCMATRQVSQQSVDQLKKQKKKTQRSLLNREYIEQVKKQIRQKRQYSFQNRDNTGSKLKSFRIQNGSTTEEM